MTFSNRPKSNEQIAPDLTSILEGTVMARWFNTVASKDSTHQKVADYVFTNSIKTNLGSFELVHNQIVPKLNSKVDQTVVCELCAQNCIIPLGKAGRCSARVNVAGRLISKIYGRPVSLAVDPIEKKPLYHFLPGTPILSLGAQGCNLSCKFCQNWRISNPSPLETFPQRVLEPQRVVELALQYRCPSVAFTYNEPTIWAEYVIDVGRLCRKQGIRTVAVTNGMICGKAREDFYNVIDATNVDLKSFNSSFYQKVTGGSLEAVKSTLSYLARDTDVSLEITNLIIPSYNDTPNEIKEMCSWIIKELGADIPLHFSAFFPAWRLTEAPRTKPETLAMAFEIAKDTGIKYVYCGNINDESRQTTYCPNCGETLIRRSGGKTKITPLLKVSSTSARCMNCSETIVGIF